MKVKQQNWGVYNALGGLYKEIRDKITEHDMT